MSEIVHAGAGLLFMKVGTHAKEGLAEIVARKRKEIEKVGYTMWGYGGNTCHPSTMVQPFAQSFSDRNEPIHLVMEAMESNHFADPLCAAEASSDSVNWFRIPNDIEVRGSRFALVINELKDANFTLPLHQTTVPVGKSTGRLGSQYIAGRVDKACLTVLDEAVRLNEDVTKFERPIHLTARLVSPYAVFLRNYRS